MFTSFLSQKIIVAVVLILTLLAGGFATQSHIRGLKLQIEKLKSENTALSLKIELQNKAVQALKDAAEKKQKEARIQIEKAKKETENAKKQAETIYNSVPSTPDDMCKSALDLINGVQK